MLYDGPWAQGPRPRAQAQSSGTLFDGMNVGSQQPQQNAFGAAPQQQQTIVGEPFIPGQSSIKTRDILYRLVISQLFYDGYQQVAVALSNIGEMSISFLEHILTLYPQSTPTHRAPHLTG